MRDCSQIELVTRARRSLPGGVIWASSYCLVAATVLILVLQATPIVANVEFVWTGAVTSSSARLKARLGGEGSVGRIVYSTAPDLATPKHSSPDTALAAVNDRVIDLALAGLYPATMYYYAVEIDGVMDTLKRGQFATFHPYGAADFEIALGSCASTASNHAVFGTIQGHNPILFLHMGDFHYENISVNDPNVFRSAYRGVLNSINQSALHRHTAIDYVWDDHDYGPNNSDSTAAGREASRLTYQEYVPHYPLGAGSGHVPIYHTFAIGRALFIVTDCRSARSPASAPDNAAKTMLGATQKAWFKQQLLDAQDHYPLKVWVNSLPWVGSTGDDGWHLYTNERREIADFVSDNGITGLCILSGDAHMLAIDDGTNSDYATGGGAPMPVFHAAALDRSGSVKGGPYSEGAYSGGGQFGLMRVIDSGGSAVRVEWSGRTSTNIQRVSHTFAVDANPLPCDCSRHGDVTGFDGTIDVLDVVSLIDHAFRDGLAPPRDLNCPHLNRGDLNCDAVNDILDVVAMVNLAFRNGLAMCDPCACPPFPANCP